MKEPHYTLDLLKRQACDRTDYQQFEADFANRQLIPSGKHKIKAEVLSSYFQAVMPGKTVIDIGCDKGLFSYLAYKSGAISILAYERNAKLTTYRDVLFQYLGVPAVFSTEDLFLDQSQPAPVADCVMALAVLHEIKYGSLEDKIRRIRKMSLERSLIEFCEDYQSRFGDGWNLDVFKSLIRQHYRDVGLVAEYPAIGELSGTRYIFDCCCGNQEPWNSSHSSQSIPNSALTWRSSG